jgi:hypothetical protein
MPIAPTGSPRALQACTMDAVRIDGEDARTQPRRRERERMNSFKAGSTIKGWFVCLLRIRRRNNEKSPPPSLIRESMTRRCNTTRESMHSVEMTEWLLVDDL